MMKNVSWFTTSLFLAQWLEGLTSILFLLPGEEQIVSMSFTGTKQALSIDLLDESIDYLFTYSENLYGVPTMC